MVSRPTHMNPPSLVQLITGVKNAGHSQVIQPYLRDDQRSAAMVVKPVCHSRDQ
jgi:hypothetical protein